MSAFIAFGILIVFVFTVGMVSAKNAAKKRKQPICARCGQLRSELCGDDFVERAAPAKEGEK